MQLGMVGLGRMGANMARRLVRRGHRVAGWDRDPKQVAALAPEGIEGAADLRALVRLLDPPRAVWLMLPAGEATERAIEELAGALEPGDLVVDGGNAHFKDDVRRARALAERGLEYADCGTSGGVWGLERGYCLMLGGSQAAFERLEPALRDLAPGRGSVEPARGRRPGGTAELGYLHCGPAGAGHFVKMVHNGIEYGLMQAYAEGFDLLEAAASEKLALDERYELDLADVAELWRRGSVVGSWLLDLSAAALAADPALDAFEGRVPDSGEGRWTIEAALEREVPVTSLAHALFARYRSRRQPTFGDKLLSAMRKEFGGHAER
jgi:6-phosphogluconate dehydrogenase